MALEFSRVSLGMLTITGCPKQRRCATTTKLICACIKYLQCAIYCLESI